MAIRKVIEIICLAEHLVTECDMKNLYEECPLSGLAVKKTDVKTWREGPNCKAKPSGSGQQGETACSVLQ